MRSTWWLAAALSVVWTLLCGADDVRRVAMPQRLVRGDTSVRRLGPWDSAAWIWRKDAPLPRGLPTTFVWKGVRRTLHAGSNRLIP